MELLKEFRGRERSQRSGTGGVVAVCNQDQSRELGPNGLGAVVAVGSFICYSRVGVLFDVKGHIRLAFGSR